MVKRQQKRVSLRGSALFKITSPARLARVLCIPIEQMAYLVASSERNYCCWQTPKGRAIEEPKALLKRVHQRVAWLLGQIETPDYLHSAIKGRSYITNASGHSNDAATVKLDIKSFFPSATSHEVFRFFQDVMEYPADVAHRITTLLTYGGHLPTGGNASCILSFWAYKPMFDEIAALAASTGCHFTLYVDDMTITGHLAGRGMQHEARRIIGRYKLRAHKNKVFEAKQPRIITGVAQTIHGPQLPRRRAKAIEELEKAVGASTGERDKLAQMPQLVGRLSEANEVDRRWRGRKASAINLRRELRARQQRAAVRQA